MIALGTLPTVLLALGNQVPLRPHSASVSAQGSSILSPDFEAFVQELVNNTAIPGVAIGAVRLAGENQKPEVQLLSWGRKTEEGDGNDLTTDTLFGLASCSKAFLATSLGLLIEDFAQGRNVTQLPAGTPRLDWDTKIAAILPDEWRLDDEWSTRAANIQDVLGHVSGLPRHDLSYAVGDTAEDIVRRMRHLRTAYELREQFSYNNQMYVMGAHIIAKYANMSYPDFIAERLFKPLNMSSTTLWPSEAEKSGKRTHTWTPAGRRIPYWFNDEAIGFNAGPGGIISSADDMVNWLAVLLNKGVDPASGNPIFPRSVYDAVTTAHYITDGAPTPRNGVGIVGYGMGWNRWTYDGVEMVHHTGGIPGFSTVTAFSPSSNLGIVILINADQQAEHARRILLRAFDDVLGTTGSSLTLEETTTTPAPLAGVAEEPLSLDLDAYTGTFSAPGYPVITLCAPTSTSHYCAGVLSDFAALGPVHNATIPRLYGAYKNLWASHIRLRHASRDTFALTFTALFPNGYGRNTSAFEAFETGSFEGRAEFVVEGGRVVGFSLVDDEEAVAARVRRTGGSVKETGDAWFAKV